MGTNLVYRQAKLCFRFPDKGASDKKHIKADGASPATIKH